MSTLPLMMQHGTRVSTSQIATAAGIAEGTIFRVFPDKEALIAAVVESAFDPAPVERALAAIDPALSFDERLTEAVAIMLSLVAPYTAEEMWSRLGHEPTVARAGWPTVDPALLVESSVIAVVQVQGKVKARLDVSPDISASELEALALADPGVVRAIEGREVRRVIVREPSLVNIQNNIDF